MEVEYQGMKFKGGKVFIIISLIGAIIGGGWTVYKFYDDYLDMKAKILTYTSPDLSSYDERLAILKTEIDTILDEVGLISEITIDIKNDLKTQIRQMEQDIRHITQIVNDVEDRQKEDAREIFDELKVIEQELELNIKKALSNPLAGLK
tara:strand:+ start:2184 stop:2630 length:447 start_codon:yes stop_codon:yes gene_type:complete